MISSRGRKLIGESSPLVVAHFACADDKFDPVNNPEGKINFGTAENHLMDAEILLKVNEGVRFSAENLHYTHLHGSPTFRTAVANLLTDALKISDINPANLVVASGASAILEAISMCLFEEGEGLIVPAPFYTGFVHDFSTRFGVKIVPYQLSPTNGYAFEIAGLKQTIETAQQAGIVIKAILICMPQNPLGVTYSEQTMQQIVQVAQAYGLDIIADEIYAQSVYAGQSRSMLEIGKAYRQHIHFVYGFAKDFVLSGFKTGIFYSENEQLVAAMQEVAYFYPVSTHTQRFLENLIADKLWCETFIEQNRAKLLAAYTLTKTILAEELGVKVIEANAGIFVWADFSAYLEGEGFSAELALFHKIFNECDVSISPGQFFNSDTPGWFRICFAQPPAYITTAIMRLKRVLI